ncbi:MAG TPA: alpha/beta hydrolase-fold protein [Streptosporangiaceae bacterium]
MPTGNGRRVLQRRWVTRAVIIAACLGIVLAGLAGVARYVTTYSLYRGFGAPALARTVVVHRDGVARRVPVIPAKVEHFTLASRALGGYGDAVYVVLPPGYAAHPAHRYPVLYLLHGVPGYPSNFLTIGRAGILEAELVAAGRMQPMILVMPSGGRALLDDHEWANGVKPGNDWENFVAKDLVATIDARYRTIGSQGGRGLAGLSEGGYGSLNIGLHHPGEFALLESWSGYMRADRIAGIFGHSRRLLAYNSPADTVGPVANQLRADRTYFWFYTGTGDRLKAQNQAFDSQLGALDLQHHFLTRPGKHSWALWRAEMPAALVTASEHLAHG